MNQRSDTPNSTQQRDDAAPHRQIRASYTDHTIRVYQALLPVERVYQPRVDDLTHLAL